MLTGVVSVTFREKSVDEVIAIARVGGLDCIEWGSDVHVPAGDVATAARTYEKTVAAGLSTPSYGSYYYLAGGKDFTPFLESARALHALNIRVWGGDIASDKLSTDERSAIVSDARRISNLAAAFGITISIEFHPNSITDTCESTCALLTEVNCDNFMTYWQARLGISDAENLEELSCLIKTGKLTNAHIYRYNEYSAQCLLSDGQCALKDVFGTLRNDSDDHMAFIEFVKDGSDESFLSDCAVINALK
ncbi:MAG: hypothetical protein RSA70_04065 [Clostridia bacterium]